MYLGLAVVQLANLLSAWFDWQTFSPELPDPLWRVLVGRAAVAALAGAAAAVLRWLPRPGLLAWTMLAGCAVTGVMQTVVSYEHFIGFDQASNVYWYGIFAFFALTVPPVPLRFGLVNALVLCTPALVLHTVVIPTSYEDLNDMVSLFVLVCGMGAALSNRLARSRRQTFDLLASQRQANVQLQSEVEQRTEAAARLQEDKSDLEARLQRAQQLEALGRLAAGVAHDLNNLLTPVMGYTDLAHSELSEREPEIAGMLQEVTTAADKARDLVEQLLAFGRRQVLVTGPLDLNRLVADHEGILRQLVGESVELRLERTPQAAVAEADTLQLGRVLMNLAVNAADAMRGKGTLTVSVRCQAVGKHDDGLVPGDYVVLTVRDTGSGMDDNTRRHIFEPFFTTKRSGHSGLGLATVYGIVQQHGGSIRVQSRPGEGTAFEVFLRASSQTTAAPVSATSDEVPIASHSETVLLVEDDDEVRRLVRAMLRRAGFRVLSAAAGNEALAVARGHRGPIHVLLTDVTMPGMSGPELWASLRDQHPETRVLFMSGYTDQVIGRDSAGDRRTAFLPKPFTQRELGRALRALIGQPTL